MRDVSWDYMERIAEALNAISDSLRALETDALRWRELCKRADEDRDTEDFVRELEGGDSAGLIAAADASIEYRRRYGAP